VAQGGFHNGGPEEIQGCSLSLIMYWAPVRARPGYDLSSRFSGLSVPIFIIIQQGGKCAVSTM
jgi:hypothetical protein